VLYVSQLGSHKRIINICQKCPIHITKTLENANLIMVHNQSLLSESVLSSTNINAYHCYVSTYLYHPILTYFQTQIHIQTSEQKRIHKSSDLLNKRLHRNMTVQSSLKSSSMAVQSESKSSPYRWHRKEIYDGQLTTD
jgi:hypothetical protein